MDLFAIERYTGDGAKPESSTSVDKANHFQRLLAKIDENKEKAKQEGRTNDKLKPILIKPVKAQKRKAETDVGSMVEETTEKTGKKKKKSNIAVKDEKAVRRKRKEEKNIGVAAKDEKPEKRKSKGKKELDSAADEVRKEAENGEEIEPDNDARFTVLGDEFKGQTKSKVARVVPYWMENPTLVSTDLQSATPTLNALSHLDSDLIEKLNQKGISHLFPVQQSVIPWLVKSKNKPPQFWSRDLCVCAPTGSGKTLTFVLPIIQALRNRLVPKIRALVVVPVKELAMQVHKVFLEYINVTDLKAVCLGDLSFANEQLQLVRHSKAEDKYYSCADIVVTTAGRLVDHLQSTKGFTLHHLKYLVIDEADRVIERMHNDWLLHLERHLLSVDMQKVPPLTVQEMGNRRPPPQKLLFSATLTSDPEKLQKLGLFRPVFYSHEGKSLGESSDQSITTPAELSEYWVACEAEMKPLYLYQLLLEGNWKSVLVFANEAASGHRLSIFLNYMLQGQRLKTVGEFSSLKTEKLRKKCYNNFNLGHINILVCTEVFARGLDFPHVECVISYDIPMHARGYIHRVGRACRAGRPGTAITLVERASLSMSQKVFKRAGVLEKIKEKTVDASVLQSSEDLYQEALEAVKMKLEHELNQKSEKSKKVGVFQHKKRLVRGKIRKLAETAREADE